MNYQPLNMILCPSGPYLWRRHHGRNYFLCFSWLFPVLNAYRLVGEYFHPFKMHFIFFYPENVIKMNTLSHLGASIVSTCIKDQRAFQPSWIALDGRNLLRNRFQRQIRKKTLHFAQASVNLKPVFCDRFFKAKFTILESGRVMINDRWRNIEIFD